jgi:arsenate reductase
MAEAMTNAFARAQGVEVRAMSAGTVGGKELNAGAVEAMREIGISMAGQTPKLMTQEMVDGADKIISMGCGVDAEACPARFVLTEDWGLDDPAGQPIEKVREIRDQIELRVQALLTEISSR